MSDAIDNNLQTIQRLWQQTEEVLSEWTGEGNLQVPVLLGMMAVRFNWNEKQVRDFDPMIRFHLRNHPDWYMTRGVKGGIQRASERQKKEAALQARALVKQQMQAVLDAKMANNVIPDSPESDEKSDEESDN